jgi:hypothetical protein
VRGFWLGVALFTVVVWFLFASAIATNRCVEWAPFFPRSVTGWHDEGGVRVKCFEGMVVDYKEGS